MKTRSSVIVTLVCGLSGVLLGQTPPAKPRPSPEYKRLEYFLGTWRTEGEIRPNPFVPAGKIITTETYTLGPGGFYVELLRPEGALPETRGIMTYDSHARTYANFYVNSAGLVGSGTGTVDGNTWTWMLDDRIAGRDVKGRTTITESSSAEFAAKYEMADGKGGYITITEGKATKVAPISLTSAAVIPSHPRS